MNTTHPDGIDPNLQDLMHELGVLSALTTMLTIPFAHLGTVAFYKVDETSPLLPRSRQHACGSTLAPLTEAS